MGSFAGDEDGNEAGLCEKDDVGADDVQFMEEVRQIVSIEVKGRQSPYFIRWTKHIGSLRLRKFVLLTIWFIDRHRDSGFPLPPPYWITLSETDEQKLRTAIAIGF
jgi:hypothetical protein